MRASREFLARPGLEVAPALLGATINHAGVSIRLTEVEAYAGSDDPGSHAYRGQTPRTEVMFGPAGRLYVYFTYGMHYCANVVTGPEGVASAVLLRAGEVVDGHELAAARRPGIGQRDWARGPARLTRTLALGRESNGVDLCADSPEISLDLPSGLRNGVVRAGPRVGVAGPGGDGAAYPWRFWLDGEPTVSAYRPGARRSARRRSDVRE